MSIRILLADDHVVVRQGLKAIMERERFEVVGEASDGQEALRLVRSLRPDIAVLDLSMPRLNGLDTAREILRSGTPTRVILLTMHTEDRYVVEAIRARVAGYVVKTKAASDLVEAIRGAARGEKYFSSTVSRVMVEAALSGTGGQQDPLTSRERQVLQLIAEGQSTKEAAAVLGISVKTAESHRSRIMRKLGIHETAGLVRYAIRWGLAQP